MREGLQQTNVGTPCGAGLTPVSSRALGASRHLKVTNKSDGHAAFTVNRVGCAG